MAGDELDETEAAVLAAANGLPKNGAEFTAPLLCEKISNSLALPTAGSIYTVLESLERKGRLTWRWNEITAQPHLRLYTLSS